MKAQILSDLFRSRELADLLGKMHPDHLRDDLRQELFVILCEKPEETICALHERKQLRFYVARVVLNMIASNSSPFHKQFRQYISEYKEFADTLNEDWFNHGDVDFSADAGAGRITYFRRDLSSDFNEVEEKEYKHSRLVDAVHHCLESLPFYEKEIMKDYARCGSAGKMIKEMKNILGEKNYIPKRTILATVKKVKEKIQNHPEVKEAKRA